MENKLWMCYYSSFEKRHGFRSKMVDPKPPIHQSEDAHENNRSPARVHSGGSGEGARSGI
jgi:hypothetical protein